MNYILSLFFGSVQGITEFLPISSSGHLVVLHALFPHFAFSNDVVFDVALHIGTLAALLIFFWSDVRNLFIGFFSWCRHPWLSQSESEHSAFTVFIAIIPAFFIGAFFENIIESSLRSTAIVALMLIAVAMIFLWLESRSADAYHRFLEHLSLREAFFIGVAQTLAFIPGTSRSGITIAAGMLLGLRREQAARFSFLIALPIVAGAGLKKMLDLRSMHVESHELILLALGFLSSAVVGMIAIRFLLQYLRTHSLRVFAWYRIIFAVFILVFFFF